MSVPELPGSVRSLIEVGIALTRRTASGKVLIARYEPLVDYEAVPGAFRDQLRAELEGARAAAVEPFKGLDKSPVAITPTAQVHRRGDHAVKVARPGVAAKIRSELVLVDTLAGPLRMVFGALDVRGVMAEVRETVMDELDLEHEAETQQRIRRALRRLDGVVVPEVELEECDPTTLVTEWLDGETLTTATPEQAERLIAAHLIAWRDAGLVPTDARPSHVLELAGGDLGLLGLGLARPADRDRMELFVAAFTALADPDPAAFVAADAALGILPEGDAERTHALLREILGPFVEGEAALDAAALHDGTMRAYERIGDLLALAGGAAPEPKDIGPGRMLGQLVATLARYGVTADWPALVARAAAAG